MFLSSLWHLRAVITSCKEATRSFSATDLLLSLGRTVMAVWDKGCYKPARNVLMKWSYPVPLHYWNFLQNRLIWHPGVKKRLGLQNFPCKGEVKASMGLTWRARNSWLQRSMRAMSKRRLMAREVISGRCSVYASIAFRTCSSFLSPLT